AKGCQPELGVVGLTAPLLPILRPVVHQEENTGTGHTLTQGVEKALRLRINPVQIFKDQDKRLVETLAQKELLDSIKRSSAPNLRVHLLEWGRLFFYPEQSKEVGQGVFETAIQHQHFAAHFLPPLPFIVLQSDGKVSLEQFDH